MLYSFSGSGAGDNVDYACREIVLNAGKRAAAATRSESDISVKERKRSRCAIR